MKENSELEALRERLNWTQEQMAAYLGLDRSSVSRMENGQKPKGPVQKLLEVLAASSVAPASPANPPPEAP